MVKKKVDAFKEEFGEGLVGPSAEELSRRGKKSRRKGRSFEQEIARSLRPLYPEAKRGLQSRGGTKEVPDIDNTPFYFECKREKSTNPKKAWKQAADGTDGRPPVAVCKDDNGPILVTMELSVFLIMLEAVQRWAEVEAAFDDPSTETVSLERPQ